MAARAAGHIDASPAAPPPIQTGMPRADGAPGHRLQALPAQSSGLVGNAEGQVLGCAVVVTGPEPGDEPAAAQGAEGDEGRLE